MFFEFSITVPAATAETSRIKIPMKLTVGIIHFAEFDFPAGCNNQVFTRVKQGGVQIWPRNLSGTLSGNFFPIRFNEILEIKKGETNLTLESWAPITVFQHKIRLRIGLLQPGELFPEVNLADLIRSFFRLFRRR